MEGGGERDTRRLTDALRCDEALRGRLAERDGAPSSGSSGRRGEGGLHGRCSSTGAHPAAGRRGCVLVCRWSCRAGSLLFTRTAASAGAAGEHSPGRGPQSAAATTAATTAATAVQRTAGRAPCGSLATLLKKTIP